VWIGWAMSDRIDQNLTRSALLMALRQRQPSIGLMVLRIVAFNILPESINACFKTGQSHRA
jgi:hypothetical protein